MEKGARGLGGREAIKLRVLAYAKTIATLKSGVNKFRSSLHFRRALKKCPKTITN